MKERSGEASAKVMRRNVLPMQPPSEKVKTETKKRSRKRHMMIKDSLLLTDGNRSKESSS
jgi:hypothetical protein